MKTRYWILCLFLALLIGMAILPITEYVYYHLTIMEHDNNCKKEREKYPSATKHPSCTWFGGPPETPQLQIFIEELFNKFTSRCVEQPQWHSWFRYCYYP